MFSFTDFTQNLIRIIIQNSLFWYLIPQILCIFLLFFYSIYYEKLPSRMKIFLRKRWMGIDCFSILIILCHFMIRWPIMAIGDIERDESVNVSASISRHFAFFDNFILHSGSGSVLLSYPMAIIGFLGIRIDYGLAKFFNIILVAMVNIFTYLSLRNLYGGMIARISIIPLVLFLCFCNEFWNICYCSEHWINFIAAINIYYLTKIVLNVNNGNNITNTFLLLHGSLIGLQPLVKWQGLPIGFLIIVASIYMIFRGKNNKNNLLQSVIFLLSTAIPLLLWITLVLFSGEMSFIYETYFYSVIHQGFSRFSTTFYERILSIPSWSVLAFNGKFFIFGGLFFLIITTTLYWFLPKELRKKKGRKVIVFYFIFFCVTIYAAIQPGGTFPHYSNLFAWVFISLSVISMADLLKILSSKPNHQKFLIFIFVAVFSSSTVTYIIIDRPLIKKLPYCKEQNPLVQVLKTIIDPGDKLLLWGWDNYLYVETYTTWAGRIGAIEVFDHQINKTNKISI